MRSTSKDRVSAIAFLALSAFVFYQTYTRFVTRQAVGGGPFADSAFYPRVVAGAMAVVSLILLLKSFFPAAGNVDQKSGIEDATYSADKGSEETSGEISNDKPTTLRLVTVAGLLIVYTFTLRIIGYFIGTPIFLASLFALLGVRRPIAVVVLSVTGTLIIYLLFSVLLNVTLPIGRVL